MKFSTQELARYSRQLNLPLLGQTGQYQLKTAKVLCIGAGGLGNPALMYLAAAGVGTLGIMDGDQIELSNLHRQILFQETHIGHPKAKIAQEQLQNQNSDITILTYEYCLNPDNAFDIIAQYDVVLDCSDNISTRYLINDTCYLLQKPEVYASIYQFEGQCTVFSEKTPCYRCLFPEPPPPELIPNCAEGGVLGILPGLLGVIQATEALKIILKLGENLTNRLLTIDTLNMHFNEFPLATDPNCPLCSLKFPFEKLPRFRPPLCTLPIKENLMIEPLSPLNVKVLLNDPEVFLLDVREPFEHDICHISPHLIPLTQLPHRLQELNREKTIIVYCKSGSRSLTAARILRENGFPHVANLEGGILQWIKQIEPEMQSY